VKSKKKSISASSDVDWALLAYVW